MTTRSDVADLLVNGITINNKTNKMLVQYNDHHSDFLSYRMNMGHNAPGTKRPLSETSTAQNSSMQTPSGQDISLLSMC